MESPTFLSKTPRPRGPNVSLMLKYLALGLSIPSLGHGCQTICWHRLCIFILLVCLIALKFPSVLHLFVLIARFSPTSVAIIYLNISESSYVIWLTYCNILQSMQDPFNLKSLSLNPSQSMIFKFFFWLPVFYWANKLRINHPCKSDTNQLVRRIDILSRELTLLTL